MTAADDARGGLTHDSLDQLRHDLKTPLTAISGRTQLMKRGVRRSLSLPDEERTRMLEELAVIEAAVREMVTLIDDIGRTSREGPPASPGMGD